MATTLSPAHLKQGEEAQPAGARDAMQQGAVQLPLPIKHIGYCLACSSREQQPHMMQSAAAHCAAAATAVHSSILCCCIMSVHIY
jgi:hypothetical protein